MMKNLFEGESEESFWELYVYYSLLRNTRTFESTYLRNTIEFHQTVIKTDYFEHFWKNIEKENWKLEC